MPSATSVTKPTASSTASQKLGCAGNEARDGQQRDVRAEPVEGGLAVREQPRVPEEDVEADRRDADDQNLRGEARVAADRVDDERKEHEPERRQAVEAQLLHPRMTSLSPSSP